MNLGTLPTLETLLKAEARRLGFALSGVAPATAADGFDRLQEWLDRGYAGEMTYMQRHEEARRHPRSILSTVRSVVMVGMEYAEGAPSHLDTSMGRVARYAQGPDYHDTLWEKLDQLLAWLRTEVPECNGRGVVDSAPLLERDFARRAGLGWIGKNTMLIDKHRGSFFFLAHFWLTSNCKPMHLTRQVIAELARPVSMPAPPRRSPRRAGSMPASVLAI